MFIIFIDIIHLNKNLLIFFQENSERHSARWSVKMSPFASAREWSKIEVSRRRLLVEYADNTLIIIYAKLKKKTPIYNILFIVLALKKKQARSYFNWCLIFDSFYMWKCVRVRIRPHRLFLFLFFFNRFMQTCFLLILSLEERNGN